MTKVRTYEYQHDLNQVKLDELRALLPKWRSAITIAKQAYIRELKDGRDLGFLKREQLNPPEALGFGWRQWVDICDQARASMRSWAEITSTAGRSIVADISIREGLSESQEILLYRINKYGHWWKPESVIREYRHIDPEDLNTVLPLAKEVISRALKLSPFPVFGRLSAMVISAQNIRVEEARDIEFFNKVARVKIRNGYYLELPLFADTYLQEKLAQGTLTSVIQFSFDRDGELHVRVPIKLPSAEKRTEGEVLGIDWGMTNLISTSDGRKFGGRLFVWLKERDLEILALQRALQKNGINPRESKRYRRLISRTASYIENEVGRILNNLADEDTQEIVAEQLDFRHSQLSPTMNRLLRRFGLRRFNQKLALLEEDTGITTSFVNPAYTSQTCSSCGRVNKSNRRGSIYQCDFCGRKIQADINGARNILERRSRQGGWLYVSKEKVRKNLDREFCSYWNLPLDRVQPLPLRPVAGLSTSDEAEVSYVSV